MKLLVFLLLPCLSLSEIVPGFGKCSQFFLKNGPPQFTPQWSNSVQEICQCVLDDNDDQKYLYATLYHTDWRIPIYSAYVFRSRISVGRCDVWYIEPQLDDIKDEPCMASQGRKKRNNQAVNSDYKGSSKLGYDKGHLYPVQHTYDHISMLATSTLTNAAPQDSAFNQGKWKKNEEDVAKVLKCCKSVAYVVTGVVPDTNIKLNNRVTVSKYYWRAYCCLENGVYTGKGYFGPVGNNKIVEELSITDLQTRLATEYKVNNIIIFPSLPFPPILPPPKPSGRKRLREDDNQIEDDCNELAFSLS